MKELYYVNGEKEGCTWKELLQWFYNAIFKIENHYVYGFGWVKKVPAWNHIKIREFFSDFKNNPNDGIYKKGYFKRETSHIESIEIVGPLREREGRYHNITHFKYVWVLPTFTPKKYQVTDSYGRIIPSGYIRDCLFKFKPCLTPKKKYSWRLERYGTYEFRRGPVPGRKSYRSGHWHKYEGDHGNFGMEVRSTIGFVKEYNDLNNEYNINIRYNRSRASFAKMYHTDWDYPYHNNGDRSWKRTRIKKQWMRGLRNKSS